MKRSQCLELRNGCSADDLEESINVTAEVGDNSIVGGEERVNIVSTVGAEVEVPEGRGVGSAGCASA